MTKFKRPKPRFDRDLANDGRWIYIDDAVTGEEYGGFLCGLFDPSVPRIRLAAERQAKMASYQARGKRPNNYDKTRESVEWFVETCLFDWDMKDEDDKPIKFTKPLAVEYFMTAETDDKTGEKIFIYDYVFQRLFEASRDVSNFQSLDQNEAGDPAKN
ncbi:MAG: hypothetical protein E7773_10220 [Sphingomonas sp.]|uniref:hypothetical protein n=1 Tax=Sphingomonas sp. TaxID=28214 RepID=UPI00121F6AC3|nr:hypothetical protein [Sphingomonas sp.]THD35713.1 MAG: hypothetical protein E7773_10220 [Sphingomonas sp.]